MAGNTFGEWFRVATYGESHGAAVGCVVDGCPARVPLSVEDVQAQLDRRRPGQSRLSTPRDEADRAVILSGVEGGVTLGTPIAISVDNRNARSGDYGLLKAVPRPGHADWTWQVKHGVRAVAGGGRASARETIGRVAAGAGAGAVLRARCPGARIVAWVEQAGTVRMERTDGADWTRADVDASSARCPDPGTAARGFEIGEGFSAAAMRGSEHNDAFAPAPGGGVRPATNRAGGVLGGITTGEPIVFRVAFKPVPSIARVQRTAGFGGEPVELSVPGRHDPCVLPRAVPVVEAMAALALVDALLAQAARGEP